MTTKIEPASGPAADADAVDRELKSKHRALWALGDYASVAATVIPTLGQAVVQAAAIGPGDRVLGIAAGSGNASIPAARAGAHVVASDLTPELFVEGRAAADAAGVQIEWQEGDAEHLPYPDASFDVVVSCVGVMFAPHHGPAANEMLRVLRTGGRLALIAWTPEGFVGQMFAVMKPYAAPPPPGAQPPLLWGRPEHVAELLGDRVHSPVFDRSDAIVDCFQDGATFRDFFRARYGPTVATYARIAADSEAVAALDEGLAALGDAALAGGRVMGWEYLLTTAVRT